MALRAYSRHNVKGQRLFLLLRHFAKGGCLRGQIRAHESRVQQAACEGFTCQFTPPRSGKVTC